MHGMTYLIILFLACMACAPAALWAVEGLPDASDIQETADEADAAYADFMRQSMEIRLGYLYGGGFSGDAHRRRMTTLAADAAAGLERICRRQEQVRSAIEAYEGPAWDQLYGQTGLWRRIYADCRKSRLLKCRVDLHGAAADDDAQRARTARDVLSRLENVAEQGADPDAQLLRAEALWLTGGQTEQAQAEHITDAILARDDIGEPLRCRTIVVRLRLFGRIAASDFRRVVQAVDGGVCADDFELSVQTAFLELRLNRPERGGLLAKTGAKWPQARDVMGRAILTWLDCQHAAGKLDADTIDRRTPIEISLALKAAHHSDAAQFRQVLEKICAAEQFATPLALFVYAEACQEAEPATAIRCYVRAATAQEESPDSDLEPGAAEIARRAAQLAYKLFYEDNRYLDTARLAMGYYCRMAGADVDEQLEYLYSKVLREAPPADQWRPLCEAIAAKGGLFSADAQLDLIAAQLEEPQDNANVPTAAERIEALIASLDDTDAHRQGVKRQATALYCKLLLERNGGGDVQKALEMLERPSTGQEWTLHVLKATALDKAARTEEAVAVLAGARDTLTCEAAAAVYSVLVHAVDEIELYQSRQNDFGAFADRCRWLAAFCVDCADAQGRPHVELMAAEIVLCAGGPESRLTEIDQVLNGLPGELKASIGWLRCRARLLMLRGKYEEAFTVWAELRSRLDETTAADQGRTWAWWRAKYYELSCFLQAGEDRGTKVAHAVEVLEGTFGDIPPIWAEKLAALKTTARRQAAGPRQNSAIPYIE